jgi:succinate dehydrogenase / fumarate reductase iron-sulfur subunit
MSPKNENTKPDVQIFDFRVFRYDKDTDEEPRFDHFEVEVRKGMTVLECLLKIQDEQDGSLAFRYSCRGAVCGSCGMLINGMPDLACRVQVFDLGQDTIVVEPLPNLVVIRDLVVDMEPFWEAYRKVEPWLHEPPTTPEKERLMSEENRKEIDQYISCILCACCYGSCPVLAREGDYTGPAALAKLYRFMADSRDTRPPGFAMKYDSGTGVWACHTVFRCVEVCPKDVRPTDGIEGLRRRMVMHRLKHPFARSGKESEAISD